MSDNDEYEEEEEEIATPEEMKAEAVARMKALKIFPETIRQFEEEDLISISEGPAAAHYWVDDDVKKAINNFESRYGNLVYYGIKTTYREMGTTYSLFYISKYKSEWPLDWDDMLDNQQCVFVYNQSAPDLSESGAIGYKMGPGAGLLRTW